MKVASLCAFYLTLFAPLPSILRAIKCSKAFVQRIRVAEGLGGQSVPGTVGLWLAEALWSAATGALEIFLIVDFFVDINFILL
jgi:hypothetical protein